MYDHPAVLCRSSIHLDGGHFTILLPSRGLNSGTRFPIGYRFSSLIMYDIGKFGNPQLNKLYLVNNDVYQNQIVQAIYNGSGYVSSRRDCTSIRPSGGTSRFSRLRGHALLWPSPQHYSHRAWIMESSLTGIEKSMQYFNARLFYCLLMLAECRAFFEFGRSGRDPRSELNSYLHLNKSKKNVCWNSFIMILCDYL